MTTESIYVIQKGSERVTVADNQSSLALVNALMALDCTEPITKSVIHGNRQNLDVYEVIFLDKHINVITMQDAERVIHWMLSFGCTKASIEKLVDEKGDEKDDKGRKDSKKAE